MKKNLSLILGGLLLLNQAAMAQTAPSLTVSASIPAATGLTLAVTQVNMTGGLVFGAALSRVALSTPSLSTTAISFGMLTFNSSLGIYTASSGYAVSIGTSGGTGTPIVNITYTEGSNPNGVATNGLGTKTTATFVTANAATGAETVSSLGKKRLIDLTGTAGELTSIPSGSYEKVYVGIWTGSTAAPADPSNGKPFTTTDVGGTYTGTLTFTAVTL